MPTSDSPHEISRRNPGPAKTGESAKLVAVLAGSALVVLTLIAYLPCLDGGYVLDDEDLVGHLVCRSSDGLYRIWFTTQAPDYWPLTYTMFWFEWRMWGKNPLGYHLINVALHIAASLLIWAILRKLSVPGAYLAALLFALHPVNVESVAWIAQRKNTLAMLFFLASIWCYLKFDPSLKISFRGAGAAGTNAALVGEPPADETSGLSSKWYWLSLFTFLLALLSKGSVAIFPALMLVIIWLCRPITLRDLKRSIPFFALAALFVLINMRFQAISNPGGIRDVTILQRLLGAGAVVWFYLYKALLPFDLAFVYPQWNINSGNVLWWLPLLATAATTIFLWLQRNRSWGRPLLAAWIFYCIALLPVMGFTDVGFMRFSLVADHYQHIAIIAVVTLVAAGLTTWSQQAFMNSSHSLPTITRSPAHSPLLALPLFLITLYAWLTWQQAAIYHDAITVYTAAIEKNPQCWMLHGNLGDYLFDKGKIQPAIKELNLANELYPDSDDVHYYLGKAARDTGHPLDAIAHFRRTVELKPGHMGAHLELAQGYTAQRRPALALEEARKALAIAQTTGNNEMISSITDWIQSHSPKNDAAASPQGP